MIPDWQTNKVYVSDYSEKKFKKEITTLTGILKENNVSLDVIKKTYDYYCRDFMPVQVDKDHFVQFDFKPDYLLKYKERLNCITNMDLVKKKNVFYEKLILDESEIILDGGNVIKSKNKVIITDKVIENNPMPINKMEDKLKNIFKAKVIIIPRYPGEETGHADGIVRFLDEERVLTLDLRYEEEEEGWAQELQEKLFDAGLEIVPMPETNDPDNAWRYINYLQVKNLIVLPKFNIEDDEIMLQFFKDTFKDIKIEQLYAGRIARHEGVLNCFTWNILE